MNDPYLEEIVAVVEAIEGDGPDLGGLPLTLQISGLLVSGRLVSRQTWLNLLPTEDLREHLRMLPLGAVEPFLHMSEVQFWGVADSGLRPAGIAGVLWRGRLDAVEGWFRGQLARPAR